VTLEVRKAVVADAPAIAGVQSDAWRKAYAGLLPDGFVAEHADHGRRTADWSARLARTRTPQRTFVAVADEAVAGFVSLGAWRGEPVPNPGMGELYALYVRPTYWRRGIGTALVNIGAQVQREDGFLRVRLWVIEGNDRALGFYRRHGWLDEGHRRLMDGTERSEQLLVRTL